MKPLSKKWRRRIGRLVKRGRIPAQTYRLLLATSLSDGHRILYLSSQNATIVAYQ